MTITVYGTPAPQGSKKFVGTTKQGRGILVESSKKVRPWRQDVKEAAIKAMGGPGRGIQGPVVAIMVFTVQKPKTAPKTRRTWPDRKPDLSKLVRSTEDALIEAGAIEDDARIISCSSSKVFPREGENALDVPGALIILRSVNGEHQG